MGERKAEERRVERMKGRTDGGRERVKGGKGVKTETEMGVKE